MRKRKKDKSISVRLEPMDVFMIDYIKDKYHLSTTTATIEKIIRDYIAYGMDEPKK